ncbi:N-carbamoylputrescine amidase [Psychrobacter sp. APC 3426]|uniref:N-carbamoylputrescine amidase n=1 Tax=Psychrobacter sp. APC 3426 TaxID=3035177 RepID=UPI0025B61C22|nr:N-carbamoylputrescine amidase [Psychrobacter sp. APC 3426]MDN3398357.1 N-carbamoylputrescine amidase [Psychrobacter sp. APC 3426]
MRNVTIATTQMTCGWDIQQNINTATDLVTKAAKAGANIILLQELFETPYFCQLHDFNYFKLATTVTDNAAINHFKKLAKALKVVIPISFYEKSGNTFFNSVTVIDADGEILGTYRKTHIPDGIPYAEKFYFTPGDTGFKVWNTKYAKIGVGICWDQWFPECARSMALMGAEILFYPTAIGDEPTLGIDSKGHWQRCMQGHAAANLMPVVAANRIGTETISQNGNDSTLEFYGSSFITDGRGEIIQESSKDKEDVITATFDLDKLAIERRQWGVFRDRRPSMYGALLSH